MTVNACRDLLKSFFRSRTVSLDDVGEIACTDEHREVLEAVLALPAKYRDVVYLFYYEQYTASEIAALLRRNENTVYTQLKRAKALCGNRWEMMPMDKKIQRAFEDVRADEALKDGTAALLHEKLYARTRRTALRRAVPAVCCALLLLFALTGYGVYSMPVAAISVEAGRPSS